MPSLHGSTHAVCDLRNSIPETSLIVCKMRTGPMKEALVDTAKNEPVWTATTKVPTFARLKKNVHADVVIVGAGIAGLSCGYILMKAGKSVVILDDGPIAGGMTQVTTAHLTN